MRFGSAIVSRQTFHIPLCNSRCPSSENAMAKPCVRVYNGDGAGSRSVLSTVEALHQVLKPDLEVHQMSPQELLAGEWHDSSLALVMPGGADLPYCRKLNGKGNCIIRAFVENGGAYIGLCAGAYYASSYVEFGIGTKLEVKGSRELAFFKGKTVGPVYPGFCYESEAGAHAAPIAFRPLSSSSDSSSPDAGVRDLEREAKDPVASSTGTPEVRVRCRDYSNGGPFFQPLAEGPTARQVMAASAGAAENFTVLAVYTEKEDAIAALKCHVGRGRAVLVGTHPELAPKWLASQTDAVAIDQSFREDCPTQQSDEDVREGVREQLQRWSKERHEYLCMLLHEAGLGEHVCMTSPHI